MQFFLDFCTQLLDEHQAVAAASSAAERSAAAAAASSPGALETDADSGAVAAAASGEHVRVWYYGPWCTGTYVRRETC